MGVASAEDTCATLPETCSDKPVAEGAPTVSPSASSAADTCAMVSCVGP